MEGNKKGLKQKQERLGEIRKNKKSLGGYEMKIIEYNKAIDIIVEFQDEYKTKVHTTYQNFKKGEVKNPYHPSVYGVGYYGQGRYESRANEKQTKAYKVWKSMLQRCYDPYYINREPAYIDVYVCEEWLNFQNFAKWFYKNYYECNNERMELDKDILIKGNKIYSPKTCIFVPKIINDLFIKNNRNRGKYPIGVIEYYDKKWGYKRLGVKCNVLEGRDFLGYFSIDKPFQAFTCYKNYKENYIKKIADEYKDLIPKELYDAMYRYQVEIDD